MYHTYVSETFIQLQLEIEKHPLLVQRLQKHPQIELELIFAEVCHYVGSAINGKFEQDKLEEIADMLIKKLKGRALMQAINTACTK